MQAEKHCTSKTDSEQPKSKWQRSIELLQTSGVTALITVVLGGAIGQYISCDIQTRLKEREFRQSWMKTAGDQAIAAHSQYLTQEQDAVKRAYKLIGSYISALDDLIYVTGPGFDAPASEIAEQITLIQKKHNEIDSLWRSERDELKLLMGYYHPADPQVMDAWDELVDSLRAYSSCAGTWHQSHIEETDVKIDDACRLEKESVGKKLKSLTTRLEEGRRYAWEGWESPESLRNALESSVGLDRKKKHSSQSEKIETPSNSVMNATQNANKQRKP